MPDPEAATAGSVLDTHYVATLRDAKLKRYSPKALLLCIQDSDSGFDLGDGGAIGFQGFGDEAGGLGALVIGE